MSDQSTTTNAPTEPQLCKMGCGFFGSNATGDCCSKCFRELLKKEQGSESASAAAPSNPQTASHPQGAMDVESSSTPVKLEMICESIKPDDKKRKKKKKTSYKAMMANMTKRTKDEKDIEKEKEGLRNVTGGGTFSKIEKI